MVTVGCKGVEFYDIITTSGNEITVQRSRSSGREYVQVSRNRAAIWRPLLWVKCGDTWRGLGPVFQRSRSKFRPLNNDLRWSTIRGKHWQINFSLMLYLNNQGCHILSLHLEYPSILLVEKSNKLFFSKSSKSVVHGTYSEKWIKHNFLIITHWKTDLYVRDLF